MRKLRQTDFIGSKVNWVLCLGCFLVSSSASQREISTTEAAEPCLSPLTDTDAFSPTECNKRHMQMWSALVELPEFDESDVGRSHNRAQLHASKMQNMYDQQRNPPDFDTESRSQRSSRSLLQADFGEADALLEFKAGITNYAEGALDGWTSSTRSDYSSWTGVTCNGELHVVFLDMSSLHMNGSLGPSLSNLSFLQELSLDENNLLGEIPPELGQLSRLRVLNLFNNLLVGSIPRELGNLTSLQELDLGSEGWWFNGTIPEELGLLSELEVLNLGTVNNYLLDHLSGDYDYHYYDPNALSGPLPRSLGNCTKLRYLDFYGNTFLTGNIPEEYGKLTHLKYLSFEQNNFTGTVPPQLCNLTKLQHLNFGNNALKGRLPVGLANMSDLIILNVGTNLFTGNFLDVRSTSWVALLSIYADGNLFSGEFPELVLSASSLIVLYLNNNNFSGKLPVNLGRISDVRSIVLRNNLFEGQLPETFTNMSELTRLDLSNNKLNGTLHPLGNLTHLTNLNLGSSSDSKETTWENLRGRPSDVVTNSFSGNLTEEMISPWRTLRYLYLDTNSFTGPLPRGLGNMTSLEHLLLQDNKFVGGIPEELGNLQSLQLLWFQDNQLTGTIPARLANLQMVTEINIGNNSLIGSIPREFGNLTQIQYLRLQRNNLKGDVPQELGQLQKLLYLILYYNILTGRIPETLSNCTALENVRLSYNSLSGELTHLDFTRLPSLQSFSVNDNNLNGSFPTSILECGQLQLLDLSRNQLSGFLLSSDVPDLQQFNMSTLRVLSLASNKFSGSIPPLVWKLPALQVLDLSLNAFTGSLPNDLSGLEKYMAQASPTDPERTGGISTRRLFEQISIRKGGTWYVYKYVLEALTSFDLSANQLSGNISSTLGKLQGLVYLNLADNRFGGSIPADLGDIPNLQSLDLSGNNLSGPIPLSLSKPPLGYLNLSYNHLCGRVPDAGAFDTRYNETSFVPGNPELYMCGEYINKSCPASGSSCSVDLPTDTLPGTSLADSFFDTVFAIAFGIGFAVGFVSLISPMFMIRTLRTRLFVVPYGTLPLRRIEYGFYREPT